MLNVRSGVLGACLMVALAVSTPAGAAKYKVVHQFNGRHGANPIGAVVVDPSTGVVYGTTMAGGLRNEGVVFRQSPAGYQVLHNFHGGADGAQPMGSLTIDGAGVLYGTT